MKKDLQTIYQIRPVNGVRRPLLICIFVEILMAFPLMILALAFYLVKKDK